ncbi:MAG: Alpha-L-fucosidase [Lentisphaerae bacterium ADurb.Bin242]|nr:MAG: Alpha-L-fucosidase [Lentisphaerae bacterium ADurb.Bin242]
MNSETAWKRFPKRAIHFDFHTMPGCEDLGRDFRGDEFVATLKKAHVEYINIFAKCNLGFCYYPTKVGTVYPGLKFDLMGEMIRACKAAGIRVAVYFNAGLSHEEALRHREWCSVNKEGQVYEFNKMDHWFRKMCFNSGYHDHFLAMVEEVLRQYPVDGLLFDSMNLSSCYGIECIEKMQSLGVDPEKEEDMIRFAHHSKLEMKQDIEKLAGRFRDDLFLYFLGVEACHQPTHMELEVLPQGGWGYEYLPTQIRYIRTLGKPYYTMTGRFQRSWGDLGGLRPEAALFYDCIHSVANAGTCCIGDHLPPRGVPEKRVFEMIGRVYGRIAELDPWTDKAKPVTEIAILAPWLRGDGVLRDKTEGILPGASRMLQELKYQYDVIDGKNDFSSYKLLFLPDKVQADSALLKKLEKYLSQGGKIVSSGESLTKECGFALDELNQAADLLGPEEFNHTFLHVKKELAEDLPDMGITVYEQGIAMVPKGKGHSFAELGRGYFNLGKWDHKHEYLYIPEKELCGHSGLIASESERVWHFSFPIARNYYKHAATAYKILLGNVLKRCLPEPLLKVKNLPSYGVATLTAQEKRTMIHLLCYVPEKRGAVMEIIEEPSVAVDVEIHFRLDGRRVKKAYLAPSGEPLPFSVADGYLNAILPKLIGYQMIVLEYE